ncbi:Proteinase inhibitor I3, Kunitz legume [Parasponia andersonii]|uniref:Proteinase inhibitor I3, Kunitz legume n=1 Tax=Parasponia andersonii TaxID=3476 RepID=A0A2P5D975_PARAD|nr:Proteinase inhibitor I3, Kunitz legume [Parasponia andersonii]
MKLIGISLSFVWLAMAIAATSAQELSPVLDTSGQPLRRGVEYIIRLAITDNGGPFTLIDRKGYCPFYVGQRNVTADGIPVTFSPFEEGENIVRELKNFKVAFSGATICAQSTTWKVGQGEADTVDGRRLIATGDNARYGNYFYINKDGNFADIYRMEWCPAELCPTCRFRCGSLGSLFENGKRLAALDGSALPIVFERV